MSEKEKSVVRSQEAHKNIEHREGAVSERHEVLRQQLERAERDHHNKSQTSEQEAAREATKIAQESERLQVPPSSPAERRRAAPSKKQRDATLKSQLKEIQDEMSTGNRILSRIIHNKPIENISDVASSTIARPNALLSGSIAAFIGVTVCYFVAKYYGYQLSGLETIAAFIVGWVLGMLYDYLSVMIRSHRNDH